MICTCIANTAALNALQGCELAEIRLDLLALTNTGIMQLFSQAPVSLIATFRPSETISDIKRFAALKTAVIAGASYVDVEADAPYRDELMMVACENHCPVILSYHNFECVPVKEELHTIVAQMKAVQPDYLKIVPYAQSPADALRVLSLYETEKKLLAFCMGTHGKFSRIASYLLGAPFIYAASASDAATADGQMTIAEIKSILEQLKNS